jgi:DNA repair exonuclease SbcCD ATPase subunit
MGVEGNSNKGPVKIDYLDEDTPIKGQEWVCVSFLSPEGVKNTKLRAIKFRGGFETREDAEAHAKDLHDQYFHVFVGQMGKWLPWNPDPNSIDDQEYQEEELNNLMKAYKSQQAKAKKMEEERKKQLVEDSLLRDMSKEKEKTVKSSNTKGKTHDRLIRKLEERKINAPSVATTETDKQKIAEIDAMKELASKEGKRIDSNETKINTAAKDLDEIGSKLNKIQEQWNKLQEKKKNNGTKESAQ